MNRFFIACFLLLADTLPVEAGDSLVRDTRFITGKLGNVLTYYVRLNAVPKGKIHFRLVINAGFASESYLSVVTEKGV